MIELASHSAGWPGDVEAVASAVTALAAIVAAVVGGMWALFRYRRERPHLPRINADIRPRLRENRGVDYISFEVEVVHVAGGVLDIVHSDDSSRALVEVKRLGPATSTGLVPNVPLATCEVLVAESQLAAGEEARDHGLIAVSEPEDTVGYEVTFRFAGRWKKEEWTWARRSLLWRS